MKKTFRYLPSLIVISSGLFLSPCHAATDSSSQTSGTKTQHFNPNLLKVASQLDKDGVAFSITYLDKDIQQFGEIIDTFIDPIKKQNDDIPQDLSIKKIINHLGINHISAMGRSSRWNGRSWHNRLFLQTNGYRDGILSIMGGEGQPWQAATFAPDDADLVVEYELDLRKMRWMLQNIMGLLGSDAQDAFNDEMQNEVGNDGLNIGGLLDKLKMHTTLIVSIQEKKRWRLNEIVELPTTEVAIKLDTGSWLWHLISKDLKKYALVSEKSGIITVRSKEAISSPMGKLNPILVYNKKQETYWVALNESYLARCLSNKNTLGQNAQFQQITSGLPKKGNALLYVSPDFCNEIKHQILTQKKQAHLGIQERKIIDVLTNGMLGNLLNKQCPGYAWCLSNTPQGILIAGNSPMPEKGYGVFNITSIATLASMTTPVIIKQQKKASTMEAVTNAKQLFYLLTDFDQEYGEFPSRNTAKEFPGSPKGNSSNALFRQFFLGRITMSEAIFYAKGAGIHRPDNRIGTSANHYAQALTPGECGFTYITGQASDSNSGRPILCAPMTGHGVKFDPIPYGGKAIVLRIDGAVKLYQINANGDVILPNGKKLFENGKNTVWGVDGFKPEMLAFPERSKK